MSSHVTVMLWLFPYGIYLPCGITLELSSDAFWRHSLQLFLDMLITCVVLCLSAANLRAQGRWVDALRQDAGWDQWEPRRSRGTGQRLMLRTPHWQLLITFSPVHYTTYSTLHNTARGAALSSLWLPAFSTYYYMNWPEEICRAGMDRKDKF